MPPHIFIRYGLLQSTKKTLSTPILENNEITIHLSYSKCIPCVSQKNCSNQSPTNPNIPIQNPRCPLITPTFDKITIQHHQQHKIKHTSELENEAQLKTNSTKPQEITHTAEKNPHVSRLHPVTTQHKYRCAYCEALIPKESRVMAQQVKAFFEYPGRTYFITLHFCNHCQAVVEA
jgi:hypothetical protein